MSKDENGISVVDDPANNMYIVRVAGEEAGFSAYKRSAGRTVFTHTEIGSEWEGKGVGSALARAALDAERDAGRSIVPSCPFIAGYIKRHEQYLDLVEPAHRAAVTGS